MTRTTLLLAAAAGIGLHAAPAAAEIHVPNDFPTIQTAISVAGVNEEIIVAPGTYFENINTLGKVLTIRSSGGPEVTFIDAGGSGECIRCVSDESPFTVIKGFTLQNGLITGQSGAGGALCILSSPTFENCIFRDNESESGAAMYNFGASPILVNCLMYNNEATTVGFGGAMYNNFANPLMLNCTIADNTGSNVGGIYNLTGLPRLFNCIVMNNTGGDFGGPDAVSASHCDVPANIIGTGNITADPLFVDAANGDYQLQAGSPCIDRADSTVVAEDFFYDLAGNLRGVNDPASLERGIAVFAITVDMGSYEFQVEGGGIDTCPADIDDDNVVGFADLLQVLFDWGPCP